MRYPLAVVVFSNQLIEVNDVEGTEAIIAGQIDPEVRLSRRLWKLQEDPSEVKRAEFPQDSIDLMQQFTHLSLSLSSPDEPI
jgi:hypothetical protein